MCWPLRRLLGRPAAFGAAALFAFGPSYLYFGRFAREDIYIAAITLALVVAIWLYIDRPRTYHPAIIGALLAASFATKETTFITVFVMGSFFLFSFAIPHVARAARRRAQTRRLGGLGLVLGRVRGVLHAALHDVPDPPRRALGRRLHRPEVLAGPARRRPRRRAVAVLPHGPDHDRMAGPDPRRDRRGLAVAAQLLLRRLPALGLLRLADRLLLGGREVRLARPAPAAAGDPARRRRPAGDLADARGAALGRPRRRRDRAVLRRPGLVVGQRGPRRRPARDARLHPVRDRRQEGRRPGPGAGRQPRPGQAAADGHDRLLRRAPPSRTPGTSATCRSATSTSRSRTPRRPPRTWS